MMKIKMLRNLALKPDAAESDQRYEGQVYDLDNKEAKELIASGLAVDLANPDSLALIVSPTGSRKLVHVSEVPVPPLPPPTDPFEVPVPPKAKK